MSKIKEYYFEEINNLNQENFDDVEYEIWLRKQEDLYYQKLYEENKITLLNASHELRRYAPICS